MIEELKELYRYRELLIQLMLRDLKVRYKGTALGFLWSFLNPLFQVLVITVVFKYVMKLKVPNFSAFVLTAYIPWSYFSFSLLDSAQSLLLHFGLLKKVYFPREIIPLSILAANTVQFLISLLILGVYMIWLPITPSPWLLLLPVLVVLQILLNTGLSLWVSAMNIYYEDVKYLVALILNLLFYVSPIVYLGDRIEDPRLFYLYRLNPMSHLILLYQKAIVIRGEHSTTWDVNPGLFLITAVTCVGAAYLGYRFFNARKWEFAELA
jgi:ABC-type polysaccharide/polyol phosphate export permease